MASDGKLGLVHAVAMAVGGMVGGGIFAVLGTAVHLAGDGAWLAFAIGGVLALNTRVSDARLTVQYDEPGGAFSFIEELAGDAAAGSLSWFLVLGYIFTVSLYSHTFGVYAADLLGLEAARAGWLGLGALVLLTGLNLVGVRASGRVEDLLVYGKLLILGRLVLVGLHAVGGEQLQVLEGDRGPVDLLAGTAVIFVAYEGFQLLTYDYDDIGDHHRNLPRTTWISIPLVTVLYVLIALVTTASLSADQIQQGGETVLAEVVRPSLGRAGVVAVLVAAVLSTASAIESTLFATSRLARRVAERGELPGLLVRHQRGGVPVEFLVDAAAVAGAVQWLGSLEEIATFSSLVFLLTFAVVNGAALRHRTWHTVLLWLPALGAAGCLGAVGVLLWRTAGEQPVLLATLVGVAVVLAALRELNLWRRSA